MLGLLRTLLAVMVMAKHLFWHVGPLGSYPVFAFYMISGYLMTLTLHESYGYSARGRARFAFNRFLRLYPLYWAVALISLGILLVMASGDARAYHYALYLPRSIGEVLSNALMVYPSWIPWHTVPRLSPPTWALTVELFFYVVMAGGASRTLPRTMVWVGLSVLYFVATLLMGLGEDQRYFPVAAGSLPFSLGALLYFVSRPDGQGWLARIRSAVLKVRAGWLFVALMGNCLVWSLVYPSVGAWGEVGQYLNLFFGGCLLLALVNGQSFLRIPASLDKRIGDYSYPIYLLHWQVGTFLAWLIHGGPVRGDVGREGMLFILTLIVVTGLSWGLHQVVERPLQRLRSRIRVREGMAKGAA